AAVGWTLPNGIEERPIPGNRLSPIGNTNTALAQARSTGENMLEENNNPFVKISPNPAKSGKITLSLSGYGDNDYSDYALIDLISTSGDVVVSKTIACLDGCNTIELDISDKINPGVYLVKVVINKHQFLTRLMVH